MRNKCNFSVIIVFLYIMHCFLLAVLWNVYYQIQSAE